MTNIIDPGSLSDATSVEEQVNIASASDSTSKPQRGRKVRAKPATVAKPASQTPDYAALGVAEADVARFESLRLRFCDLGRRSTEQVFECGAVVAALHELTPDQEMFERLAKPVFGLSRKGAENYSRVHRNLQPFRERLVAGGVVATVLYHLAGAEPEKVEEALALHESGDKLTVSKVKAIVGLAGEPSGAKPDDGGTAGLRARIAEKTAMGVALVMNNAAALLEQIQVALEPHRQGKRIVVKEAQRPFIHPARLLREQIEALTWMALPAGKGYPDTVVHVKPLSRDDRWYELWQTLEELGGYESWPVAAEVGPWLADTVVPQLEWLLGARAAKANAVVQKMAREAEAERVKAGKAATRAKLEKKKARDKARKEEASARLRAGHDAKADARAEAATTKAEVKTQSASSPADGPQTPSA